MGGLAQDLAFLIVCCGFIKTTISEDSEYEDDLMPLLKAMESIIVKYNKSADFNRKIHAKITIINRAVLESANKDIEIELGYATCFLLYLKYAKGERAKKPLNSDIETFFNEYESKIYEIMDNAHDRFGEETIIQTSKFCYKILESVK